MEYAYIFSTDDSTLAGCCVMSTRVLVHTPIARPLRAHAVHARCVSGAVIVREVAAHKVLIGFRRADRKWD